MSVSFLNHLSLLVCIVLASTAAAGQTADSTLADLQGKLTGHRFLVRDLSGQPTSAYHLSGGHIEPDAPPLFRSLAIFIPQEVILTGPTLVFHGERSDLLIDGKTQKIGSSPKGLKITLKITVGTGGSASEVSNAIDYLLLSDVTAAVTGIPDYLRSSVPARTGNIPACKTCLSWIRQGSWQQTRTDNPSYKPVEIIKASDPLMTIEATAKRVNAVATFAYVIDENGHPTELWLTEAAGYGLDEAAADSINKSIFRPALYNGARVAKPVIQTVSFQNH